MLRNGFLTGGFSPTCCAASLCDLGQLVEVQVEARQRPHQVRASAAHHRVQGVRMLHVLLDEVIFILGGIDVQTAIRNQPAFVQRIFVRVDEGHEFVVLLKIRKLEPGDQLTVASEASKAHWRSSTSARNWFLVGVL